MKDFNRGGGGGRFGGSNRFDNNRWSKSGDRPDRSLRYSAICAECGQDCEVPFKPTGDKPVYCNNCFGQKSGFENNRFERRSQRPSFNRDERRDLNRSGFSRETRGDRGSFAVNDNNQQQFELLNAKLDNIIKLLTAKSLANKTFDKIIQPEEADLVVPKIKKPTKQAVRVKKAVAPKKATKQATAKKK